MTTKRQTSMLLRILAVVLILASAAMLLLPWMSMHLSVAGMSGSVSEMLDQAAAMQGTTAQEMKNELLEELTDSLESLQYFGVDQINLQDVRSLVELALKGAWSPFNLLSMISGVKRVLPPIMNLLNSQMGAYSDANMTGMLTQAESSTRTAHTILLILLILTLAMALVAIVCALTDHRLGILPYVIFALIMLVLFLVLVSKVNTSIDSAMPAAIASEIPAGSIRFKTDAPAFLCAGLALLGFLAMFLPFGAKAVPAGVPAGAASGGWTCPNCGVVRPADQKFCLTCGAKRPESVPTRSVAPAGWKCPNCGTMLRADQRFCLYCGSKKPETTQADPVRTIAAAASGAWVCPKCGSKLTAAQKFCPKCGSKKPEGAAAAAPATWTCPNCGSVHPAERKFCSNCGTKKPEAAPKPQAAPAPRACPACGTVLAESMSFCPKCGAKYEKPAPAVEETYVPVHAAAEKPVVLTKPDAPAEREPVTTLLSSVPDIPGVPDVPGIPAEPESPALKPAGDDDL